MNNNNCRHCGRTRPGGSANLTQSSVKLWHVHERQSRVRSCARLYEIPSTLCPLVWTQVVQQLLLQLQSRHPTLSLRGRLTHIRLRWHAHPRFALACHSPTVGPIGVLPCGSPGAAHSAVSLCIYYVNWFVAPVQMRMHVHDVFIFIYNYRTIINCMLHKHEKVFKSLPRTENCDI